MMSNTYWQERFERLEAEQMAKAGKNIAALKDAYAYALRKYQDEVIAWYERYAGENGMTLADARKQLDARELKAFKLTLKRYTKLAKTEDLPPEYIKMLDRASIRARLDRSQALYIKTAQYVEQLAKQQGVGLEALLQDVYKDSYYKTAYETQRMRGRFSTFNELPEAAVNKVISRPWAEDGKDFSVRIWENKTKLLNTLQSEITRTMIAGEGSTALAARIANRFDVSFENARRLAETETAYVQEAARMDTWTKLDVERYKLVATLDSKTSSICRHMDGKVFNRKDAKAGVTMPPFHCYCRTTSIPYIEGITDDEDSTRAARDPETGKTTQVKGDLTYEKWYNKYVKPSASEPKAEPSPEPAGSNYDKGVADAFEKALAFGRRTGNEWLYWRDLDGNEAYPDMSGSSNKVVFSADLVRFLKEAEPGTLACVHNHPRSSSFSPDDLSVMCSYNSIKRMHVIGHDGTQYICEVGNGKRVELSAIRDLYDKYQRDFERRYTEMVNSGVDRDTAWKEISHEIITNLSERYGWHYERKANGMAGGNADTVRRRR